MSQFKLPEIEEKVLERWRQDKTFEKSLSKQAPEGSFVFYEGPPTANGRPGIHHVIARAFKDAIPRYKTMRGFRVVRKAGWDTHGLPVEIEVEKRLGLKNKQEIENYGIAKFNEECRKSVWQYKEEWERMTERIAFWIDMSQPYVTYENDYIESLWWIIKQWWDKDLFYQGHKVVPHCPRCVSALSSHEVAQGYKLVKEPSVFVKFEIRNSKFETNSNDLSPKSKTFILAWTTTPWTLPGNVALAVGEKVDYVVVKQKDEQYILAKDLVGKVIEGDYEVVKELKGKDLVGLQYEPLFDSLPDLAGRKHEIVAADFVSVEDGTGVVHTSVMYGVDDYELGEQLQLAKAHTVNEDGTFNERVPQWQGKFVKDVEEDITKDLNKRGLLYKTMDYEHDYPFCWRCGTPLLYYAKDSWFVKVSAMQKQLIENNESINWVPGHIKHGRFGEWLNEIKDWAFSRERYWGTPLPIWRCQSGKSEILNPKSETNSKSKIQNPKQCQSIKVIGSFGELEELSGKKLDDYHRPFVDEVTFKCDKCGGEMKRVEDVCDVWFDSGAMPFAQYHYPHENINLIECTNEVEANSRHHDANKRRTSKGVVKASVGDSCQFPADYICEAVDQTRGWFYTLLAVSTMLGRGAPYKNVISLGHILDKHGKKMSKSKGNIVDPWKMIEQYGADTIRWHLYTINAPGEPKRFDEQALKESGRVFLTLLNVLSFYNMFAGERELTQTGARTDADFKNLEEKDLTNVLDVWILSRLNQIIEETTKRLDNYDISGSARLLEDFINDLSTWYVRRSRDRFKSSDDKVRLPALKTLRHVLIQLARLAAPFAPFIADHVSQELGAKDSVHLSNWPESSLGQVIGADVIGKMELVRSIVEAGLAQRAEVKIPVRQPLKQLTIDNLQLTFEQDYVQLIKDELNVKEVSLGQMSKASGQLSVTFDTTITEELRLEGLKRELIRAINNLRKQQGLTIQDKVKLSIQTESEEIKKTIDQYGDDILQVTIASEFVQVGDLSAGASAAAEEIKVGDEKVLVNLAK